MSEKRFVVVEVWQGEEEILRNRYAEHLNSGGVWINADGVKRACIPVDSSDISGAKKYDDAMQRLKSLVTVKLEDVKP
jgi:hypothetical protein